MHKMHFFLTGLKEGRLVLGISRIILDQAQQSSGSGSGWTGWYCPPRTPKEMVFEVRYKACTIGHKKAIFKTQYVGCFISQPVKKLQKRSLYDVIGDILPFI